MGPNTDTALDAAHTDQRPRRGSVDVKMEDGDETASPLQSLSSGIVDPIDPIDPNECSSFAATSSALLSRPGDDVPMTDTADATNTTTETTAFATVEKMPPKRLRASGAKSRGGNTSKGRGGGSASRGGGSNGRAGSRGSRGSSGKPRSHGSKQPATPSKKSNGKAEAVKREAGVTASIASDNSGGGGEEDGRMTDGDGDWHGDDGNNSSSSDTGPYCICRGPDGHRWMIQCDQCEDWFHGDCVHIDKELGESIILSYICPNCTVPDRYITRFRKLCSLPNCHRPARLYADDNVSAAAPDATSYFCSDAHRDQWWDAFLTQISRPKSSGGEGSGSNSGPVPVAVPVPEDKLPVDHLTSAQLVSILASSNQADVAQMLLHGLTQDSNTDPDALLTTEERAVTQRSAAHRQHLVEQFGMCKKMLELLDMAKARNYDAIKAGLIERDCCGYDDRLAQVGVQPHFAHFLASPEGIAIFRAGKLAAPLVIAPEEPEGQNGQTDTDTPTDADPDATDVETPADYEAATAGMCRKRKCKAHIGWFQTLVRDVRMQMQDLTREAAVQRDSATRIRRAAVQRAFIKRHMHSEVVFAAPDSGSEDGGGEDGQNGEREADPRDHVEEDSDATDVEEPPTEKPSLNHLKHLANGHLDAATPSSVGAYSD